MVHEEAAHRAADDCHEFAPIAGGELAVLDQAEVALVDESGRGKCVTGALVAHKLVREAAEVVVKAGDEVLPDAVVAGVVAAQEFRDGLVGLHGV